MTAITAASRSPEWRARRWAPRAVGIGTLVCLLLVLEGASAAGLVNPFLVPAPSAIMANFPMLFAEEHLLRRFASTAAEACAAALLAMLLGGFLGWAFYRSRNIALPTAAGWSGSTPRRQSCFIRSSWLFSAAAPRRSSRSA